VLHAVANSQQFFHDAAWVKLTWQSDAIRKQILLLRSHDIKSNQSLSELVHDNRAGV